MSSPVPTVEKLSIHGPAGPIETMIESPPDARAGMIAVCCHPHSLYGGTMQNKVVHTLARAAQDQRVTSLRFNFRGVGASAGSYDSGVGESEDATTVVDWCRSELGAERLLALGFSFGAYVAFRLATLRDAGLLVTVAPPVRRFDFGRLEIPRCPWLVAQGDADELVDHEAVRGWAEGVEPAPDVKILPGAEHFFHGRLTELRALVADWLAAKLAEKP
jgi:alpha/beta superfamily hydrolase